MGNVIPLNSKLHASTRVITTRGARYGDAVSSVSVVPREFGRLIVDYPIVLTKAKGGREYNFCVLLGFEENENLYLDGETWNSAYIPLEILRRPFLAGISDDKANQQATVYIDFDDTRVQSDLGEALFDEKGDPSPYLAGIDHILSELVTGAEQTRELVGLLIKHELIEPVTVKTAFQDGRTMDIGGIFSIHDDAVRDLSDEAIVEIHRAGYLPHVYMQQASSAHLGSLIARKNARMVAR